MQANHDKPATSTPAGQPPNAAHPDRLLRLPQVLGMVGLGRTAVLDRVKSGAFPAPLKVGRATLWSENLVQGWVADRIRQSLGPR